MASANNSALRRSRNGRIVAKRMRDLLRSYKNELSIVYAHTHRAEEFTQSTHQLLICVGKTLCYGAIIALEPSKHWTLQHNRVQSIMPVTQFINALEKGTTQTVRGRLTSFYLLLWYL